MRQVYVLRNGVVAGMLTEEHRRSYVFRYTDAYFSDPTLPAISLTLPKTQQEYREERLFPFFSNLLAEGENRKWQSRLLRIDEQDQFGLLAATARVDSIGSVTVKPVEAP